MKKIYITIGLENSRIPIANKVATWMEENESEIKVAKELRKKISNNIENHGFVRGTKIQPSRLFWGIFDKISDTSPRIHSENFVEDYVDMPPSV